MNITINLITNLQETVPNTVLTKILTVKRNGGIVNLTGNIYIPAAYVNEVLEFCTYFGLTEDENTPGTYRGNDIILSVGTSYISFEDNEVARIINGTFGSDGHTTALLAKNAVFTSSTFKNNTVILTFPEFDLFTKANTNPPASLFEGCSNLSNIDLSEITKLSVREFYGTSITDVNAPNLTTVPNESSHIFSNNSSLLTITNIGHISYIPGDMCWSCPNLESVNLPNECTTISAGAFYSGNLRTVTGLEHISNFGTRSFYSLEYLTISTRDLSNAMNIADTAFYKVNVLSINCPKLISLGDGAFWGPGNLSSVECLGKVLSIPVNCFALRSSLLTVKIPYECTSLLAGAILECPSLTTIKQYTLSVDDWIEGTNPTYGDITRVTSFGSECFKNCSLLQLSASALTNATTIGNLAFLNCSLLTGTLNLPNLTSLGHNAFINTGVTSILSLGNVTIIPDYCFKGCTSLTSVTLPSSCISIRTSAFEGCSSLTTLNAQNVKTIDGLYSFGGVAVSNLALPAIETIGQRSLSSSKINVLDLGPNLSSIGNQAFWDSYYLTTFIFRGTTVPSFGTTNSDRFLYNMNNVSIYVPESALSDYQTAWPAMASNIVKIEGSIYDTQS